MHITNTDVCDYITHEFPGEKIHFITHRGNAGDALIALGVMQQFKKSRVDYTFVEKADTEELRGKVIAYLGGGMLNDRYPHIASHILKLKKLCRHLILLPQTTDGCESFLAQLDSSVTIFCRELNTFTHTQKLCPSSEVLLARDSAFELDVPAILDSSELSHAGFYSWAMKMFFSRNAGGVSRRYLWRAIRHRFTYSMALKRHNKSRLNAFRYDNEASGIPIPEPNIDISRSLLLGIFTPQEIKFTCYWFLEFINQFDEVATDRLHVAVGAALLGKQVYLFGNSYFKCEAVYECYLKHSYPNVHWLGNDASKLPQK